MTVTSSDLLALASVGVVQFLAVMSPGPSFLVTMRTAVGRSRADGLRVALGLGFGTVIWVSATLSGLDALFHLLPWLFVAMKLAGALYLLWLAITLWRHAADPVALDAPAATTRGSAFLEGLFTQLSNPKVAVFFGSIFVAMVPADRPAWMSFALVAIVGFNEVAWYSAVATAFGGARLRGVYLRAKAGIDRVTAGFLGLLGLRLLVGAFDGRPA